MKEQKIVQAINKISKLEEAVGKMYSELVYQRQVTETLTNVCKHLPEWEKAVADLKEAYEKEQAEQAANDAVATNAEPKLDLGPSEQGEDNTPEKET